MSVDLLGIALIQADESLAEIIARLLEIGSALVIGEKVVYGRTFKFFSEQVDLVEEENDGSADEPARVADAVKEG